MIQAILFDFDGVLTTDKTGSLTTNRYLSEATGIAFATIQAALKPFNHGLLLGKTTHAAIWPEVCARLGRDIDFALLDAAFKSTPLNTAMFDLARSLKHRYRIGIITDNKLDRIDCLRAHHQLDALFDPIVVSAAVGSDKSDEAIFQYALDQLGTKPGECLFIDNTASNLDAPAHLGMRVVHFDDEANDIPALIDALRQDYVIRVD